MNVEELVKELRSWADCDARSGEPLGARMRKAADKLEELAAEVTRLTSSRDGYAKHSIARGQECDRLQAALAEKDKEIAAMRDALERIANGSYDGLEVASLPAWKMREIAKSALKEASDE